MRVLPAALPQLQGVWLALFRVFFAAAFALALFSSVAATWYEGEHRDTSTNVSSALGLGVRVFPPLGSLSWRVVLPISREAIVADIRIGDEIATLNGHPVTKLTPYASFPLWLDSRDGRIARLGFRRARGKTFERALVWRARNIQDWFKGSGLTPQSEAMARRLAYDLMTLALLVPATILFLRRPREIVAQMFAIALALLSVGPTLEFWTGIDWLDTYKIASAVPYLLVLMIAPAFPDGRFVPAWTRFSLVAVPLVYVPLILSAAEYSNFSLLTAPAFLAVIVLLAWRYRTLRLGTERQQFRMVAFGLTAGVFILLARGALVWVQAGLTPAPLSPWIDLSSSFVHALGYAVIGAGFGIALLRYRLYDAESLISRSAALTATTLLLAGVWAALEKSAEAVFTLSFGSGQATLAGIVSAALAVVLVTPLHGRLHAALEKRVRGSVWRLREELPGLAAALAQHAGTETLGRTVLAHVERAMRVSRAAIVVTQENALVVAAARGVPADQVCPSLNDSALPASGAAVEADATFPYRLALSETGSDARAWLVLGARPDGTPINRDEREALDELAPAIARALTACQARDARDTRLASVLSALEARVRALESGAMLLAAK
jgi:hypothetical protein